MSAADLTHLRQAISLARQARDHGNHPFGALLTDETGRRLLEAENSVVTKCDCTMIKGDCTNHAELNLVRLASTRLSRETLQRCTLYTSTEPCAMCAGAIFWSGIGRVVYALSEERLLALTAGGSEESFLFLPCREVFARGQRPIEVVGPLLEEEAALVHEGFWRPKTEP
ncbi:MAG TPA: nucleoside deaminase [Candidatus Limnocylindria bacterium]|nr:nucleoside deaminase [Candidatus Limnocylindria bacterium]